MTYRMIQSRKRKGAVILLVAICIVGMLAMVALAIDIGMIAVAKTQAQNAADSAAMAGARALNGDTVNNNNYTNASVWAKSAAGVNSIFTNKVSAGQVSVDVGSYSYSYGTDSFVTAYTTKPTTENWTLVRAKVVSTESTSFAKVIGVNSYTVAASATAVHRPRDVSIVLDIGGSMRYDSLLGIPHNGNRDAGGGGETSGSNNPETVYPKFGAYSASNAGLQRTTAATISGEFYNLANITVATSSGPAIVDYFYKNSTYSTKAFTAAASSYETTPQGDMPKTTSADGVTGTTFAKTVNELSNSGTAPTIRTKFSAGGTGFGTTFYGYTRGPSYWGKTFVVWPPDPRTTAIQLTGQATGVTGVPDWRARFFGTSINSKLFDSAGNWRTPSGSTYTINYTEILKWIKQVYPDGTTVFPTQLRSGRIIYYDAIPTTITGTIPTNDNERFWKRYIDYVLGFYHDGTSYSDIHKQTGYGSDYSWGTPSIADTTADNPKRPRTRHWFGPMSMVDFLGNHNRGNATSQKEHYWLPGTCTEAPNFGCKLGIQAALQDIERNHPNDYVSVIFFSDPTYSATDTTGRFNTARAGMSRDYKRMIESLWFPPTTIDNPGTEIRYDAAASRDAPRSFGGTCFAMGFMLAYNQFSTNVALRTATTPNGLAGGYGRRGANRLLILETDGQVKDLASATWKDGGQTKSYYDIVPPNYPSATGSLTSQVYDIVDRIVAKETDSLKGYATSRKEVLIHTLAFGTMFESYSTDPDKNNALDLLQNIQFKGKTQASATTALDSYKIITGTQAERTEKMRQAFSKIMQEGVQISLIE